MIVFRYLQKEVLLSVMSVTTVVLLVVMSGRFINYLQEAAEGTISAQVLLPLIGYRIPGLLELILPLGLLLGILLAYGRLYMDNEMTVLHSCGLSPNKLQLYTLASGLSITVVVALLSLWISPLSNAKIDQIRQSQNELSEFDTVTEGLFQKSEKGDSVSYIAKLSSERTQLENVFIASKKSGKKGAESTIRVVSATSGEQYFDEQSGDRFVLLKDGYDYSGSPGQADYQRTHFEQYAFRINENVQSFRISQLSAIPTMKLISSKNRAHKAQLHWRFSIPFVCLLLTILAVALCPVNNRQGRYGKILPSILLYIGYLTLLTSVRTAIEKGNLDSVMYLWLVHGVFTVLVLSLHFQQRYWAKFVDTFFSLFNGITFSRKAS